MRVLPGYLWQEKIPSCLRGAPRLPDVLFYDVTPAAAIPTWLGA